ncbi:hypothetical protein [Sphingobacterium sp. T2]|uniref:hypothetical protein n=1 Tax=Sphingobacterium sp. T2 TaxID=1590596 RepID=UPI001E30558D|nr:hypothetical protein [Sphingobacterium sp. T2]
MLIPLLISSALAAVVSKIFYSEPLFYTNTTHWELEALFFYFLLAAYSWSLYNLFFKAQPNYQVLVFKDS